MRGLLDSDDPIWDLIRNDPIKPPFRGVYFSEDRTRLFIVGIIDTLTNYTTKKKFEYRFKKLKHGHLMSWIPPNLYAERFYDRKMPFISMNCLFLSQKNFKENVPTHFGVS